MSLGSIVNTVANVGSRKSDKGKSPESSLFEYLNAITNSGVQVKSNFEVIFSQLGGFQFLCQAMSIPGLKSANASLFYKGREIQVPILSEQEHEFQWTVLNDAKGKIYTRLRQLMITDYQMNRRMLNNGFTVKVKVRSDQTNTAGMNIIMNGVRITQVSGLDFSHMDSTVQTFTVDGYVNFIDFHRGEIKSSDGLLGKIDKVSNSISRVLGK